MGEIVRAYSNLCFRSGRIMALNDYLSERSHETIPLDEEVEETILVLREFLEEGCLGMDSEKHVPATFQALEKMIENYPSLKKNMDKIKSLKRNYL